MGKSRLGEFTKYDDFIKIPQKGGYLNVYRGTVRGQRGSGFIGSLLSTTLKRIPKIARAAVKAAAPAVKAAARAAAPKVKKVAAKTVNNAVDKSIDALSRSTGIPINKANLKRSIKKQICPQQNKKRKKNNQQQKGGQRKKANKKKSQQKGGSAQRNKKNKASGRKVTKSDRLS